MIYDNYKIFGEKQLKLDYDFSNENCFKCLLRRIEELMKLLKSLSIRNDDVLLLLDTHVLHKIFLIFNVGTHKWQSNVSIFK